MSFVPTPSCSLDFNRQGIFQVDQRFLGNFALIGKCWFMTDGCGEEIAGCLGHRGHFKVHKALEDRSAWLACSGVGPTSVFALSTTKGTGFAPALQTHLGLVLELLL